jgi:hypothetical protein
MGRPPHRAAGNDTIRQPPCARSGRVPGKIVALVAYSPRAQTMRPCPAWACQVAQAGTGSCGGIGRGYALVEEAKGEELYRDLLPRRPVRSVLGWPGGPADAAEPEAWLRSEAENCKVTIVVLLLLYPMQSHLHAVSLGP